MTISDLSSGLEEEKISKSHCKAQIDHTQQ
jgi:hypothetical protein